MSSCNACTCGSCPEAPSTINITEVTNAASLWADEYFVLADVVANTITLSQTPTEADAVQADLNGVVLQQAAAPNNDYTMTGAVMVLNFTMGANDRLHVKYPYSG